MNWLQALLFGLGIAGLCLIGWGTNAQVPFLTSIGGALFGSCLGSFIGRLAKKDLSEDIKKTVFHFLNTGFISDENKIVALRQLWHMYHVTRIEGCYVWRHAVLDFGKLRVPGRLIAEITLPDNNGNDFSYAVEAGMRDERLVVFIKALLSEEPSAVYVFPFTGLRFAENYFGVAFLQTWDTTHSLSPAIICRKPIEGEKDEGTMTEDMAKKLDKLWIDGAEKTFNILPRVITP